MSTPETPNHDVAENSADTEASCQYEKNCYTTPSQNYSRNLVKYDKALVRSILDDGYLCHVGFIAPPRDIGITEKKHCPGGEPVVLPMLYGRVGETLYLHGSPDSRLMTTVRNCSPEGYPVCVTVTHVDALVLGFSVFGTVISYRSAVIHGNAKYLDEKNGKEEKGRALRALLNQVVPGRSETSRPPTPDELDKPTVIRIDIRDASAKIRTGGADENPMDIGDNRYWAGVLPVRQVYGPPISALNIGPGVSVPDHIKYLTEIREHRNIQMLPPEDSNGSNRDTPKTGHGGGQRGSMSR
ncbi:MAG: pyridoxamine 5'-phosphate oxidase family protein [Pseudonocardiaceae bacterium]